MLTTISLASFRYPLPAGMVYIPLPAIIFLKPAGITLNKKWKIFPKNGKLSVGFFVIFFDLQVVTKMAELLPKSMANPQ